MPNFSYTATNERNELISGSIDSADRTSVMALLSKQNLRPISVKEQATGKFKSSSLFGGKKVKNDVLVMFTRQLSAMVSAGVPLLRSLSSLATHTESKALKVILTKIIKDVEGGAALGDSLAKFPATFSDVYVNMVRAGEAAGILDEILKRLAIQQEKNATIRKKVKSSMTYPMVLIFITVAAFFGLMIFVIPQIGKILLDLGGPDAKLPTLTVIMLGISSFMTGY